MEQGQYLWKININSFLKDSKDILHAEKCLLSADTFGFILTNNTRGENNKIITTNYAGKSINGRHQIHRQEQPFMRIGGSSNASGTFGGTLDGIIIFQGAALNTNHCSNLEY